MKRLSVFVLSLFLLISIFILPVGAYTRSIRLNIWEPPIWFVTGDVNSANFFVFEVSTVEHVQIVPEFKADRICFYFRDSNGASIHFQESMIRAYYYVNFSFFEPLIWDTDHFYWIGDYSSSFLGFNSKYQNVVFADFSGFDVITPVFVGDYYYWDLISDIGGKIDSTNSLLDSIYSITSQIQQSNSDLLAGLTGDVFPYVRSILGQLNEIYVKLSAFDSRFTEYRTYVNTWITNAKTDIVSAITDLQSSMVSWFTTLRSDILSGFSTASNKIQGFWDGAVSAWASINSKLDQLIEGTGAAADKIEQGASDLSQAGSDLAGDVGKIEDFEDQHFAVLDQNFSEITSGGDISNLSSSLLFILAYTNHVVEAVPSNYLSYWTVPFFFGILFLICQHTAGVTSTAQAIDYSQNKPKQVTGFGASLNNSKKR